jgi:hypothetical protein
LVSSVWASPSADRGAEYRSSVRYRSSDFLLFEAMKGRPYALGFAFIVRA